MRKNRKNSIRKERIVMIASSAFVLAALTMTGIYMKGQNEKEKDDGYVVDFTAFEDTADEKLKELSQKESESGTNTKTEGQTGSQTDSAKSGSAGQQGKAAGITDQNAADSMGDDLDYMPLEAGSNLVEIPGLTGDPAAEAQESGTQEDTKQEEDKKQEAAAQDTVVSKNLSYEESEGLLRPAQGDILLHYSMDSSIYFATLDQYKYNPAVVISAAEGTSVSACAEGKVLSIFENEEIGKAVTLDLGDGYQVTYGQLKEISVAQDGYVNPGETIGTVAAPTKYYSVEGSNLYFQLTKDGTPVNPETLFR